MTEFFLKEPLDDLDRKLQELQAQLAVLRAAESRISEVENIDYHLSVKEEEARGLLAGAEMTSELQDLEKTLFSAERLRVSLGRELKELVDGLLDMLHKALERAEETRNSFDMAISSTLSTLVQRKTALDLLVQRAQSSLIEGADESEPVASDEEGTAMQSYEETVAFESSNEDADDRDRRQHHREGVSLAVRLEGDNRLLAGNTENVSVGGIFVGTPEEFELGTLVHVVCELPGGDVVEADGMVTWSRPALPGRAAGVGVEFIALSPDDRKRLEAVPGVTT